MANTGAAHAVAEFLKTPDDLANIGTYRTKLAKEKASLEGRLRSGAKAQLDATHEALVRLHDSRVAVGHVREEMVNIENTCEDPSLRIKGFDRIGAISQTHRNMRATIEMVRMLDTLDAKLDALDVMLAADSGDMAGPAPNLLVIHHRLAHIEAFRNETLLRARQSASRSDTVAVLERLFNRVPTTVSNFEEYYFALASSLLRIVKKGNPSVVVKVAKIAEFEGQRDEKAIAIRLVSKKNNNSLPSSIESQARVIKNYRSKVIDAVRTSCKDAIGKAHTKHGPAVWNHLKFIYSDIVLVEDKVASLFPPDWKMCSTWIKAYQQALYDFVNNIVAQDPDPATLLEVVRYVKAHRATMTKELDIPPELLEPNLLDGREQDLVEDYVKIIVKKMEEWMENLIKTESADFSARDKPPDEDADNLFGLRGAVILFEMINQQCDVAADSGQGIVLTRVVEEANRVMRNAQTAWSNLLDKEMRRQTEKRSGNQEIPGGLAEYTIALANDQVKSADFVESLMRRLTPLVSERYAKLINEKLNEAMDGFLDVAKKCIQVLIGLIFYDIQQAVEKLFTSSWYTKSFMAQIVETLRDYMNDYQTHLHPSLFELLIEDIIDQFLVTYLANLRRASKLKAQSTVERIREDVHSSFGFFTNYKTAKELETYFDVIDHILRLLSASKTMFAIDYWPFAKRYGSNVAYVDAILRARDDLSRSDVKDIMEGIKKKLKEDSAFEEPEGPTIFGRLPAK